jgi:hypothetical protein
MSVPSGRTAAADASELASGMNTIPESVPVVVETTIAQDWAGTPQ